MVAWGEGMGARTERGGEEGRPSLEASIRAGAGEDAGDGVIKATTWRGASAALGAAAVAGDWTGVDMGGRLFGRGGNYSGTRPRHAQALSKVTPWTRLERTKASTQNYPTPGARQGGLPNTRDAKYLQEYQTIRSYNKRPAREPLGAERWPRRLLAR